MSGMQSRDARTQVAKGWGEYWGRQTGARPRAQAESDGMFGARVARAWIWTTSFDTESAPGYALAARRRKQRSVVCSRFAEAADTPADVFVQVEGAGSLYGGHAGTRTESAGRPPTARKLAARTSRKPGTMSRFLGTTSAFLRIAPTSSLMLIGRPPQNAGDSSCSARYEPEPRGQTTDDPKQPSVREIEGPRSLRRQSQWRRRQQIETAHLSRCLAAPHT